MEEAYKEKIVYQIYPSSFYDSNNDGWGDLRGITQKLDYLKDLGVGIIWLSPIYESPMIDMGYDISDYKKINPKFGTMEDFNVLMHEATIRNIKIVMDLVINHTSSEHFWFKEAIHNPTTKYRDYYYIVKGRGAKHNKAPNNWTSIFTGSAWEPLKNDKSNFYMHLFCNEQVDLNYHNENVINEIENIMKFWFDKGVYGFRCDAVSLLWKESLDCGKFKFSQIGSEHCTNMPGNYKLITRFRDDVVNKYNGFMVAELVNDNIEVANSYLKEKCFENVFTFEHLNVDKNPLIPLFNRRFSPKKFINILFKYQENFDFNAIFFENHDQRRIAYRFFKKEYHNIGCKAFAMLLLTLRGTPYIYQGQEIGMTNNLDMHKNISQSKDIVAHNVFNLLRKFHLPKKLAFKLASRVSRDYERVPMQWSDRINAGFNLGWAPWLKVNHDYLDDRINVEDELKDKNSVLNFYKKVIKYRNSSNVLKKGSVKRVPANGNLACFVREYNKEKMLVIINLSNKKIKFDYSGDKKLVLSNYSDVNSNIYPPYFAGIYMIV